MSAENRVGLAGKLIVAGRFALGVAAPVAVIGAVEACGDGSEGTAPSSTAIISTETPMPSATAMATQITESPTPSPTPESTPSLGYHQGKDGALVYTTEKGEVLNVPQIEGLRVSLQATKDGQQKVVYAALEQNPYGMSPEEYAGEYKPNVEVQGIQTGGVVLKAPVVLKLIDDKLATIPEQKDKWTIPLPIDISTINTKDLISISFSKDNPVGLSVCKISFGRNLTAVNIIPSSTSLEVLNGDQYTTYGGQYMDAGKSSSNDKIVPGKEMNYLTVAGGLSFTQDGNIPSNFGDQIVLAQSPIVIYLTAATEWRDADERKILDAGDSKIPVFLATNTP